MNQALVRRDRDSQALNERRERASEVLAPIGVLLSDAGPTRLTLNAGQDSYRTLGDLDERWLALRERVLVWGNAHPADDVPLAAQRLVVAVGGDTGFIPSYVIFPSVGCWRVLGEQGGASLTFVVKVTKVKLRA